MNKNFDDKYLIDEKLLENIFSEIWLNSTKNIKSQKSPKAYILGGQPGGGKSVIIAEIFKNELEENALIISGDDYRRFHPKYNEIAINEGKNWAKFVQNFSSKITQMLIAKAKNEKFNVIIEGTFRTANTPIATLSEFKDAFYQTHIALIATPAILSRKSCLERYQKQFEINKNMARFTNPADHDIVVKNLAKNICEVLLSKKADYIWLFSRDEIIFKNLEFQKINTDEITQNINKILDLNAYEKAQNLLNLEEQNVEFYNSTFC